MIAFDVETTGLDYMHGARPFFVSMCDESDNQRSWEWAVDPLTREVDAPKEDVEEIVSILRKADRIVGQNIRFDVHMMARLHEWFRLEWPWEKTDDTIIAAHLLGSNQPKGLTELAVRYLEVDISAYEKDLAEAVKKARTFAKSKAFIEENGEWGLADEERTDMPSAKGGRAWAGDYWLPKCLYDRFEVVREEHPTWETALREYASADTPTTLAVFQVMEAEMRRLEVTKLYRSRMEILPVTWQMEEDGVTVSKKNLDHLRKQYQERSTEKGNICVNIAKGYGVDLTLPKNGVNDSLRGFLFDTLKVPPVFNKKAKTDSPTLNKEAMTYYLTALPERSKALTFIQSLSAKRKVDTSLSYMDSYHRYGVSTEHSDWFRLHPSINPVGTDVTRRSSSNPNEQNISGQPDEEGLSLRFGFGPAPGREWWSMDYENIELRIPSYEAGEQAMIDLFENPDAPPYFGSNHLLAAHILWPKEFEEWQTEAKGWAFKDKCKPLYKRTKNGNFAVQYGAMEQSGTADRAYGQKGAQAKIQKRLGKINDLNKYMVNHATKYGYVYTMPDKTVDPKCGYPVMCTRSERGAILPTVPLSYHVQGTAGWCTGKALIRTHAQLREWNNQQIEIRDKLRTKWRAWIAMEVHDELVFDFPKGGRRNLPKINKLRQLMSMSGDDIGVPLKVSVSYHPNNWAEEVECI